MYHIYFYLVIIVNDLLVNFGFKFLNKSYIISSRILNRIPSFLSINGTLISVSNCLKNDKWQIMVW